MRLKDKVIVGTLFATSLLVGTALVYSLKGDDPSSLSERSDLPPVSLQEWVADAVVEPALLNAWEQEFRRGIVQPEDSTQWLAACVNPAPPPSHEMHAKVWLEQLSDSIHTQEYYVPGDDESDDRESELDQQHRLQFSDVLPVLRGSLSVAPHWPPIAGDHFVIRTLGEDDRVTADTIASISWQRNDEQLVNVVRMPDIQGGFSLYQEDGTPWRQDLFTDHPLKQAFPVSSGFSMARKHPVTGRVRPHMGVDFMTPVGTPVVAQANGRIAHAGRTRGNGYYLVVEYPGGIEATYLHLKRFASRIETGAAVAKGQVIAQTGNTGLSSGPHLHYELKVGGTKVDPLSAVLPVDYALAPVLEGEFENYLAVLRREAPGNSNHSTTPELMAGHMLAAAMVSSALADDGSEESVAGLP
ncbi:M23 family metallopeptidase [Marinobacterium sp. BA1]|uniref:M23 family metallopeptidase n=1 Tax=Marinobacterium sp. BA1 TaxID=3138931 RepID=UPI0034E8720F